MDIELDNQDHAPHLDHLLSPKEEQELNFLMVKLANCKSNLENCKDSATRPSMLLEHQIADLQYKHRWSEIRLSWVREQSLRDMEEIASMHARIASIEQLFNAELANTVNAAVKEKHKFDEFDRMVMVYKNGLTRGAERALKQQRKE